MLNHLPEEQQSFIEQKLIAAWNMAGYAEARRALDRIHDDLERINPSAARSLAEGLDETLIIHRLQVPAKLRLTLFSTNPIESALSVVASSKGQPEGDLPKCVRIFWPMRRRTRSRNVLLGACPCVRSFSIASGPHEETLMAATRVRDTAFKHVLRTMPLGTAVKMEGPSGDLTLPDNFTRASVLLAGKIRITPFRSMICLAAAERLRHQIFLFYSNRRPEDAPFLDELESRKETIRVRS